MELSFELLHAEEIECRIGTTKLPKGENAGGVSLLLYKDARCDMTRLDNTVGAMNWQRSHTRDNANCTVSIWDNEKSIWVSKEDTGVASRTEAEKGLASDSFKRACVNWGIGRELYTAPFIWISGDPEKLKWERFRVKEIGYNESRCINALTIVDKRGKVVFKLGKIEETEPDTPDAGAEAKKPTSKAETVPTVPPTNDNPVKEYMADGLACMQEMFGIATEAETLKRFIEMRKALIEGGVLPAGDKIKTIEEARATFEAIYKNFAPSAGESA